MWTKDFLSAHLALAWFAGLLVFALRQPSLWLALAYAALAGVFLRQGVTLAARLPPRR